MRILNFACYQKTEKGVKFITNKSHEAYNDNLIKELGGLDNYISYVKDRLQDEIEEDYDVENAEVTYTGISEL